MQPIQLPPILYATFAGVVDTSTLYRIFQSFSGASQAGVKEVHLLFQSTGGFINDGVSLYNFLRTQPLILHAYNTGAVQSIAVLAYLAAIHQQACHLHDP